MSNWVPLCISERMHLSNWRARSKRWMALCLALRKAWAKIAQSLMFQMQSNPMPQIFRWENLHFNVCLEKDHQMGSMDALFNLLANVDMFRPSNALWRLPRVTWSSWARIWRRQSSCVAHCSRATRSTVRTSTAKNERSSSCRHVMKMLPTSLMKGETAIKWSWIGRRTKSLGAVDDCDIMWLKTCEKFACRAYNFSFTNLISDLLVQILDSACLFVKEG